MGLGGAVIKNLPASAGDTSHEGSIPGLGRSPGGGNGNPFQYSFLENSMDRGTWRATVHGVAKSRTQLSNWAQWQQQHLWDRLEPIKKNQMAHQWISDLTLRITALGVNNIKGSVSLISVYKCNLNELHWKTHSMPIVMINCLIFLSGHRIVCGRARDHVIPGSSHPQTPLLRSNPNPVCLGSANSLQFYILWRGKKILWHHSPNTMLPSQT